MKVISELKRQPSQNYYYALNPNENELDDSKKLASREDISPEAKVFSLIRPIA